MPDAPGLELIRGASSTQAHPDAVLETSFDRGQATLIADPGEILSVLSWLREYAEPAATTSSPACTSPITCPPSRASASTTSC